jgi:hypothetical protein
MAAREVWGWFVDHLDALLDSIRSWRCDQFEMHLRQFWSSLSGNHREVVHAPAVAGLMAKADAILYDVSREISSMAELFMLIRPTGNPRDFAVSDVVAYPYHIIDCCQAVGRQDGKDPPRFP